jgi:glycosyltransferase involved in cell wall biosynthesis
VAAAAGKMNGLVMVCDVDLEVPDATRTHTIEVAANFAREGFRVDLVTRGTDPELEDVRFHRARGSEAERGRRIADLTLRTMALLCRERRRSRRCYVRYSWINIPILIAARALGYRVVVQIDDVQYGRGYEPDIALVVDYVKRGAAILMGHLAHGVVAVTPEIKRLLVDQFHGKAERIAVLPNGVDVDFFHPLPRAEAIARLGLDPALRYVVFSGGFQPWVDFSTLLRAFAIVAPRREDARLILVGDGSERPRVERQVRDLDIEDVTLMTGFVKERSTLRDYLAAATITLSANHGEYRTRIGVSPVKLAEYMACARAVIATELPGLRATIEETGAGVVAAADPDAVAEAIEDLLDPTSADELGAHGRRLAQESYSWRSIVRRTLPLFGL